MEADGIGMPAPPVRVLIVASSNTVEVVARALVLQDPANRRLLVVNDHVEHQVSPDEHFLLELRDYEDFEREGDEEVLVHLYPNRRAAYRRSKSGTVGSTPYTAHAAGVRQLPELVARIRDEVRALARDAGHRGVIVYIVLLAMNVAGNGNGLFLDLCAACQEVARLIETAAVHVIAPVLESSVHDDDHEGRQEREHAQKVALCAVQETGEIRLRAVRLSSPVAQEPYFLDAPGGKGEASEEELGAFAREMLTTMLRPELRAKIDGQLERWQKGPALARDGASAVAGVAGHALVRFDRRALAEAAAAYQLPGMFACLARGEE